MARQLYAASRGQRSRQTWQKIGAKVENVIAPGLRGHSKLLPWGTMWIMAGSLQVTAPSLSHIHRLATQNIIKIIKPMQKRHCLTCFNVKSHACTNSETPLMTYQFIQRDSKSFFSNVRDPLLCYQHTHAWVRVCKQNYNCNPLSRICTRISKEPLLTTMPPRAFRLILKVLCQHYDTMKLCQSLGTSTSLQLTVFHEPTTQLKGLCGAIVPKAIQVRQIPSALRRFILPRILSWILPRICCLLFCGNLHMKTKTSLTDSTSIRTSHATACRAPSHVLSSFVLQIPGLQKLYRRNPIIRRVTFTPTMWMISTCAIFTQVPICHMAFSPCFDFNQAQVCIPMWTDCDFILLHSLASTTCQCCSWQLHEFRICFYNTACCWLIHWTLQLHTWHPQH